MPSSPAERDEYVEYFSGSGAITCRVLQQLGSMVLVQFRTRDWDNLGYQNLGNYARAALFPDHLRPADPSSPGVLNSVQALERQAAVAREHLADRRRQANGQNGSTTRRRVAPKSGSRHAAAVRPRTKAATHHVPR